MSYCDFAHYGKYIHSNYNSVKLESGMYNETGRSFAQVLERVDPSENYKETSLEGTDAFQRQLKRFDIKVRGAYSDPVEKFFRTMDSAVLFPEYISRAVKAGMEESDVLPEIAATTTIIDFMDYRSVYSVPENGTSIPSTQVKTKENLVKLNKRGRMLIASYEAIRFQKLDLFSVTLRQIGQYIQNMHLQDAMQVLLNGDGNQNPAKEHHTKTVGELTYDDLVNFWAHFDYYEMNTLVMNGSTMAAVLKLPELQACGLLESPFGARLLRTSAVDNGQIIGLDRRYALEMVKCRDIFVDYDKLIDRQLERSAISSVAGFSKIFADASKVLKV